VNKPLAKQAYGKIVVAGEPIPGDMLQEAEFGAGAIPDHSPNSSS
jgi:hypothetical protein